MGTTGWAAAKEAAKRASGGKFVRLENDGDKVVVAFLGEPYSREVVWDEKNEAYVDAPAGSPKPTLRVSFNVYDRDRREVRIMEQGVVWFKQVVACQEKYEKDFQHRYFEVKRNGAKGSKRTTYTVMFEELIPERDRPAIAGLKMHDLAEAAAEGDDESQSDSKSTNGAGEKPDLIDPEVATRLVGRFRGAMPVERFKTEYLAVFGVPKISDIPGSRQAEAVALADKLLKPAAEIDPFS